MAPRNQFIPFPSPFKIKPRSFKYNKQINKQQLNFAPLDRFGQSGGSISNGQKQFFFSNLGGKAALFLTIRRIDYEEKNR